MATGPVPAPWEVDECNTPNGMTYQVSHLWQDDEGETHTDEICEVVMDYHGDRALCNARLIAAAPELLEACREAETEIADCIADFIDEPQESDYRVLRMLRAVIAKVEGKAAASV